MVSVTKTIRATPLPPTPSPPFWFTCGGREGGGGVTLHFLETFVNSLPDHLVISSPGPWIKQSSKRVSFRICFQLKKITTYNKCISYHYSSSPSERYNITLGNITWETRCSMRGIPGCGNGTWELLMRIKGPRVVKSWINHFEEMLVFVLNHCDNECFVFLRKNFVPVIEYFQI